MAAGEQKVREALGDIATMEFVETPLRDVVEYLKDAHAILIEIDTKALDDVGIATDTPITRNLKGISLRTALRVLLRDLSLTYVVEDGVLTITTVHAAAMRPTIRVYQVAHLLEGDAESGEELAALLRTALQNPKSDEAALAVAAYGPLLIVRDTEEGQAAVERLLSQIAEGLTGGEQAPPRNPPPAPKAKADRPDPFGPPAREDPFGEGERRN
jgi:hypothetical protein